MKRNLRISLLAALLITAPLLMLAQPPHPNGGGAPTGTNTKVGDQPSAPVGSGTFILLTLAVAYAGRKTYLLRTEKE
jgi:hypothetical protein